MRSLSVFAATLTVATAVGTAIVSPASASSSPTDGVGQEATGGENCVVHLSSNNSVKCFDTFTEAIADATAGRITNAPRDARSAMADSGLDRRLNGLGTAGPGIVLAIEYADSDYAGRHNIYTGSAGCDNDDGVEWRVESLGSFNDMITSFRNYADCQANHYEHIDFEGASTGWLNDTPNIGEAMNDQTSSIQWR
ncbi:hypothetical protein BZB76_0453 [Actinomadura pelletieri DSM 43383]|uniref:Peptidase inhibitor family I36 n=1 Tax=Actinomadura pelletieri DSM 43383 TaxID=1120940 RepID=A0A495QXU7_9ACTN|nr:hypothetical protein [Actinomadura pelletieri]RKS79015.1 hypothetical protein BZB76_0453 [Actinomadura pelletieri DSM 43383]